MELRGLLRRFVSETTGVQVLAKTGGDLVGTLIDLNQKGFRLATKQAFKPGYTLEGLIQDVEDETKPELISFTARCVWQNGAECGFAIMDVPMSHEERLDKLIDRLASG